MILKIFNKSTTDSTDIRVIAENNDKTTSLNEKVDFNFTLKSVGDSKKGAFSVISVSNDKAKPQNDEIAVNFILSKKDKTETFDSTMIVRSNKNGVPQTFNGAFYYNANKTSENTSTFDYTLKANLNAENAVNLANTSKVEMEKINEQIGQGFTNYILGNPALWQMVFAGMNS